MQPMFTHVPPTDAALDHDHPRLPPSGRDGRREGAAAGADDGKVVLIRAAIRAVPRAPLDEALHARLGPVERVSELLLGCTV
jgi:hypothetical protein